VHSSPSVPQLPCVVSVQTLATQLLSQHCGLDVHALVAGEQVGDAAHTPLAQASEQQSAARAQPWPIALHSPGEAQRLTPSTSRAQSALQQSPFTEQVSPTRRQAEAGTSHLPPTQLSEQQSVLTPHGWWNDRQLEHDTPAKHCDAPKQQPPVHDCVVHWQVAAAPVPTQARPAGQGAPVEPHTHLSLDVSQRLVAVVAAQLTHAWPIAPQWVSPSAVQVAPTQQPLGQSVELQPEQRPPEQVPPAPQFWQVLPFEPHAVAVVPPARLHTPLALVEKSQQPVAHDAGVHLHVPPTQARFAPHAAPPPHLQTPAAQLSAESVLHAWHLPPFTDGAPQLTKSLVDASQMPLDVQQPAHDVVSQTHAPLTQRVPAAHGPPEAPHEHAPDGAQRSVSVVLQLVQVPPAAPHSGNAIGAQLAPEQQPVGHEVAVQAHAPLTHCCPALHAANPPHEHAPDAQRSPVMPHVEHAAPLVPQPVVVV
jgi:hypothetical protein